MRFISVVAFGVSLLFPPASLGDGSSRAADKPAALSSAIERANKTIGKIEDYEASEFPVSSLFPGEFIVQVDAAATEHLADGSLQLTGTMLVNRNLQYDKKLADAQIESAERVVAEARRSAAQSVQKFESTWKWKLKNRRVANHWCPKRRQIITADERARRLENLVTSGRSAIAAAQANLETVRARVMERKTAAYVDARTLKLVITVPADMLGQFEVEHGRKGKPRVRVTVESFDTALDAKEVGGARRVASMNLHLAALLPDAHAAVPVAVDSQD